jgi:hypothetical protein
MSNAWLESDLETIEKLFYPDTGYGTSGVSDCLPNLPGLYLVFSCVPNGIDSKKSSRTLLYIGVSTKSLKARWRNHHLLPLLRFLEKVEVDVSIYHWAFLPNLIPEETLLQWERDLIQKLRPPLNGYGPEIVRSLYDPAEVIE